MMPTASHALLGDGGRPPDLSEADLIGDEAVSSLTNSATATLSAPHPSPGVATASAVHLASPSPASDLSISIADLDMDFLDACDDGPAMHLPELRPGKWRTAREDPKLPGQLVVRSDAFARRRHDQRTARILHTPFVSHDESCCSIVFCDDYGHRQVCVGPKDKAAPGSGVTGRIGCEECVSQLLLNLEISDPDTSNLSQDDLDIAATRFHIMDPIQQSSCYLNGNFDTPITADTDIRAHYRLAFAATLDMYNLPSLLAATPVAFKRTY